MKKPARIELTPAGHALTGVSRLTLMRLRQQERTDPDGVRREFMRRLAARFLRGKKRHG
ncbi:hypothetical protein [Paucibacter soli]|uniref:hypothetical protein n=1 Tax=Paucibacter soli TaxID=3133433 RepID=UPI0030A124C8